MDQSQFSVRFGAEARTIVYQDPVGEMLFVFDVDPNDTRPSTKWTVYLSPVPLTVQRTRLDKTIAIDAQRIELARQRVAAYVESCGYIVAADR
jgi:hypothetical protein